MKAPCLPAFAHPTFLEYGPLDRIVQRATSGRQLMLEESIPRQTLARVLYRGDGTPRSPEEILDG